MSLVEKEIIDKIEIVGEQRNIQIRKAIQIVDTVTGEIKAQRFHRAVIDTGDSEKAKHYGKEIEAISKAVWTPEIIAKANKK